jgi:hypothetical protein
MHIDLSFESGGDQLSTMFKSLSILPLFIVIVAEYSTVEVVPGISHTTISITDSSLRNFDLNKSVGGLYISQELIDKISSVGDHRYASF